jgi:outer membrane protein OmpA-like peptidoglycan-associated protein
VVASVQAVRTMKIPTIVSTTATQRVPVLPSLSLLILPLLMLAACGPRVFEGQTAKVFEGTAPPVAVEAPKEEARVEVTDDKIIIREKVQFDFNKATIKSESDSLLAEVAKVMNENPRLKKIRVEGHASAEGEDAYNMKLSQKRAKAVLDHLVKKGKVAKQRLVSEGFGETQPIGTDEANRRVEFTILEQDFVETKKVVDPVTGEAKTETVEHKAD